MNIQEYLLPLITGGVVGAVFSLAGTTVPAPPNIPGVLGVVGITLGYMVVTAVRG